MNVFFDMVLFDKKRIMQMPVQRKLFSYLYVICLSLLVSLVVVTVKTVSLNFTVLEVNLSQFDLALEDAVLYRDNVNSLKIEGGEIIVNGDKLLDVATFKEQAKVQTNDELVAFVSDNQEKIRFIFFIYQYISSLKYIFLFLVLTVSLAWTGKRQLKLVADTLLEQTLTYTSYILTIPILVSALLRILNFRFSFSILILVALSVLLEFLFNKYYIKENVIDDEEKMVA